MNSVFPGEQCVSDVTGSGCHPPTGGCPSTNDPTAGWPTGGWNRESGDGIL
jgi:hypothetical protein